MAGPDRSKSHGLQKREFLLAVCDPSGAEPGGEQNPRDAAEELEAGERLGCDSGGLVDVGKKDDAYTQRNQAGETEKEQFARVVSQFDGQRRLKASVP